MPESPLLGLSIDGRSKIPLFEQVYTALRHRITSGKLSAGDRLPSSRSLSEELGISRTTVVTAYDQLVDEGFADSRAGSGVYINETGSLENLEPATLATVPKTIPASARRETIPFYPGQPDSRLFPYSQWARCISRVARNEPESLASLDEPFGDPVLRHEICRYLADWRGVNADPGQVIVTAGAGDSLELCIRSLAGRHNGIAMEDPGYPPLRNFVVSLRIPLSFLNMDNHGALVPPAEDADSGPEIVVLTPSSQFPLGGAMPQLRRTEFIDWAARSEGWIIEDDYDSEFRYAGRPIPALAGLDSQQRTLYIGSFSKAFSNSLRLGFIVLPPGLISRFRTSIERNGTRASIVPQRPLARFMNDGSYYRHIRRVRKTYNERRTAFMQLLEHYLGDKARYTDHRAGMQMLVQFEVACNDNVLAGRAQAVGVQCNALSSYYAGTSAKQQGLLMGFCGFTLEEMETAMPRLKEAIEKASR